MAFPFEVRDVDAVADSEELEVLSLPVLALVYNFYSMKYCKMRTMIMDTDE